MFSHAWDLDISVCKQFFVFYYRHMGSYVTHNPGQTVIILYCPLVIYRSSNNAREEVQFALVDRIHFVFLKYVEYVHFKNIYSETCSSGKCWVCYISTSGLPVQYRPSRLSNESIFWCPRVASVNRTVGYQVIKFDVHCIIM